MHAKSAIVVELRTPRSAYCARHHTALAAHDEPRPQPPSASASHIGDPRGPSSASTTSSTVVVCGSRTRMKPPCAPRTAVTMPALRSKTSSCSKNFAGMFRRSATSRTLTGPCPAAHARSMTARRPYSLFAVSRISTASRGMPGNTTKLVRYLFESTRYHRDIGCQGARRSLPLWSTPPAVRRVDATVRRIEHIGACCAFDRLLCWASASCGSGTMWVDPWLTATGWREPTGFAREPRHSARIPGLSHVLGSSETRCRHLAVLGAHRLDARPRDPSRGSPSRWPTRRPPSPCYPTSCPPSPRPARSCRL